LIIIIDYGVGNLGSVFNMLKKIGQKALITSSKEEIIKAQKLILPGVGAFDAAMQKLHDSGLLDVINNKVIVEKTPLLGVCLGMQLIMKKSTEGQMPGLGWLDAEVVRFQFSDDQTHLKVPHMGWNTIMKLQDHPLLADLPENARFYFVHSYYVKCQNESDVLARTNYGYDFDSIVAHQNIMGTQFHPEKSHKFGMQVLLNFARNF